MPDSTQLDAGFGSSPTEAVSATSPPGRPPARGEIVAGLDWPDEATAFAARQAATAKSEPVRAEHRAEAAAWLQDNAPAQDDPGALIDAIIARALAHPDQQTLLQTQVLLTELGRDPEMTALINDRITGEIIHRVADLSRTGRPDQTEEG
ncbi:hypothetical protein [Actinomadura rubrisoli]|uniref:Uncharacterized protein n=1 Tax=Actinomadura rubrisoli TaxID=2530368 RepID=A0A4R5ATV7_9ACTN|nr:hypothetical protein [Actinomadura rubrisoli]TDD76173.1 hypothetical protein E1298_30970 [Actinomadura rubrisoli]